MVTPEPQKYVTNKIPVIPYSTTNTGIPPSPSTVYNIYVFSMLSLGRILISDLVVANLFMHSLPGMILLYLAASFFTPKVFLHEIIEIMKL